VRVRRRDVILVPFERRTSPPEGFHFRDHSNRRGNPNPQGVWTRKTAALGEVSSEQSPWFHHGAARRSRGAGGQRRHAHCSFRDPPT
jgi:hypothetical protein